MMQAIQYIENLDLNYLVQRLVEKEGWEEADAKNSVRRYKNFLILAYKYREKFSPTPDIDEVWHAHILHTKNYMEDCEKIFGKYFHHFPSSDSEEEKLHLEKAGVRAAQLYMEEFGEAYHGVLDINSFW